MRNKMGAYTAPTGEVKTVIWKIWKEVCLGKAYGKDYRLLKRTLDKYGVIM